MSHGKMVWWMGEFRRVGLAGKRARNVRDTSAVRQKGDLRKVGSGCSGAKGDLVIAALLGGWSMDTAGGRAG